MAINVRCMRCRSDHKLGTTFCKKCDLPIGSYKKFKVAVKTPEGRRVVRLVGTLALAKKVEDSLKGKVAEKKHLGIVATPHVSFVWNKYLEWAKRNKKSWKADESRWKTHIEPYVSNRKMDGVTKADVEKILNRMEGQGGRDGNGCSQATIKQASVLIGRLYNWAKEHELYDGSNPAANIKVKLPDNRVTECLTEDELYRLMAVLKKWPNQMAAQLVRFALFTGLRLGEVMDLKWKNIDMQNGYLSVKEPKGKPVTLPINKNAIRVLALVKKISEFPECPYVFHNRFGEKRVSFANVWYHIRKAAELPPNFRFHGLRHTFASYLASSGEVDIYTLQKLLNHQDPKMTQRYAHLLDEALRRGANVADKVFGHS